MTADNKDCLGDAGKTTLIAGGLGLVVSAMQNTVQKHTEGAKGVFTRTGGTIGLFGNEAMEAKTIDTQLLGIHSMTNSPSFLLTCSRYGWYLHSW